MKIIVTGGAGFIGSALVRHLIENTDYEVVNLDKLIYTGNLESVASVASSPRYHLAQVDICDREAVKSVFDEHQPTAMIHLAAESHVDRSIDDPSVFVETNVRGTYILLEESRRYWMSLEGERKKAFCFQHVSTDEVYGDLGETDRLFTEESRYLPSSPYSASKAASDHFVRAWNRTYGLPVLITNCSNNYGPFHFPEKLIPHTILRAILGKTLPVYGDGCQVRDWLFVDDHIRALLAVFEQGRVGETYNIGGHNEKKNIDVVKEICVLLEELAPDKKQGFAKYEDLITFVQDRPGHDLRYAIDASKMENDLGWRPEESFATGLRKTVIWYLENQQWWEHTLSKDHRLSGLLVDTGDSIHSNSDSETEV